MAKKKKLESISQIIQNGNEKFAVIQLAKNETLVDVLADIGSSLRTDKDVSDLKDYGTSVPYITTMFGDIIVNPSTVGTVTFKKMMEVDETINMALNYNISAIVSSISGYVNKNKDIQKVCRHSINNLKRGFRTLIKDLCQCFGYGYSDVSKFWGYDEKVGGKIIIDVQPLPQSSILYRIDPMGNLQEYGIGQYIFNSAFPTIANLFSYGNVGNFYGPIGQGASPFGGSTYPGPVDTRASEGDLDVPYRVAWSSPIGLNWLETDNIMHMNYYNITNGKNPYGKSALRPVYNLYIQKYGVQQFYMTALMRRSTPLLVVHARQTVPISSSYDPNNPQITARQPVDASTAAQTSFANVNCVSTIILPGLPGEIYEVKEIKIEANLDIFEKAIDRINNKIQTALGMPTTSNAGGDGGSYALAVMHGQSNSRIVSAWRDDVLDCVLQQFIRPIIEENFTPDEHENDWGYFEVEQIGIDEKVKNAALYKSGIESQYLFPADIDDCNHMRDGTGAPRLENQEQLDKIMENQKNSLILDESAPGNDKRDMMDIADKPYAHSEGKL